MDVESQDSTIDYYHERKRALMRDILRQHHPLLRIDEEDNPFCMVCRRETDEVNEMHVEHPNKDSDAERSDGGWQMLYKYEADYDEGKTLWVCCDVCHYLLHKRREDGHAERLARERKYLQEEYEDMDAEFILRQRRKEAESII